MPGATDLDQLVIAYHEITAGQRRAMDDMNTCAQARSICVRKIMEMGYTQLETANLLDVAQSTVQRLVNRPG